jgi:hypothetical protein
MSDLTPEDEALIARARDGLDPGPEDHARIKRGLLVRIAGTAAATAALSASAEAATSTAIAGSATGAGLGSVVAKAVIVGVLGAAVTFGGYAATRHAPGHAMSSAPSAAAAVDPPKPPAATTAASLAPPPTPTPTPTVTPTPTATATPTSMATGPSTLVAETELLARAGAALKTGDAPRALELLDQHASSFPGGVLVEEREAERIVVLCALGRTEEARAAAAVFLRERPRSPQAARVRATCGGS